MTIPVSTVPAVKAYLKTTLEARSEFLNTVLVEYGPATTFLADEMVMLGDTRGGFKVARMVGGGGQGWLDEEYVLDITVHLFRGDDDPQAAENRLHTIAAVICDTVRLDPSLGNLVTQADPAGFAVELAWDDEHLGVSDRYVLGLRVQASL
jgi:hypothetical protein